MHQAKMGKVNYSSSKIRIRLKIQKVKERIEFLFKKTKYLTFLKKGNE